MASINRYSYRTEYGLELDGKFTKFRTKALAIKTGKSMYKMDNDVKLIERSVTWLISSQMGASKVIEITDYDRTILIK